MASESTYQRLRGQESPASSRYVPQQGLARYKPALQTLLPIRTSIQPSSGQTTTIPLEEVGFFSYATFHWLSSILWTTYRTRINEMFLPHTDSCDINGLRLENMWMDSTIKRGHKKASIGCVAWRFVRTRLIVSSIIQVLSVCTALAAPWILINHLLKPKEPTWFMRLMEAFLIIGIELMASFLKAWSSSIASRTAGRLRSAFLAMTYKKLIKLADPGPAGHSSQKLLQDAAIIHSAVLYGPHVITAPIVMVVCIVLMAPGHKLPVFISSSFIITLLLLWLLVSLSALLTSRASSFASFRHTRLLGLLENFKLIKMTLCEKTFLRSIKDLHRLELVYMVRSFFCDSVSESILQAMPLIAAILLFCKMDKIPLEVNLLVIILLFTHVKDSMFRFWYGFKSLTAALTALDHLKAVLVLEDGESFKEREKPIAKEVAVSITNASFVRRNQKPIRTKQKFKRKKTEDMNMEHMPELVEIDMQINKGMLVGLVGDGSSALLLALLGQLPATRGFMMRAGRCAFVTGASPWIMPRMDIRDNVTLPVGGAAGAIHQQRYYKALHDCCLHDELAAMPQDDRTITGDIALTHSMAQRIALARALYCTDRDIYLLDEPLSAVGQSTSVEVFNRSILMGLRDKTVVLATYNIQFLSRCNEIYVLDGGRIIEQGTHEQLLAEGFKYPTLVMPHRAPFLESAVEPPTPRRFSLDKTVEPHAADKLISKPVDSDVLRPPRCWLAAASTVLAISVAIFCISIVLLMVNVINLPIHPKGFAASDQSSSNLTDGGAPYMTDLDTGTFSTSNYLTATVWATTESLEDKENDGYQGDAGIEATTDLNSTGLGTTNVPVVEENAMDGETIKTDVSEENTMNGNTTEADDSDNNTTEVVTTEADDRVKNTAAETPTDFNTYDGNASYFNTTDNSTVVPSTEDKISVWDLLFDDLERKSLLGVIAVLFGSGSIFLGLVWRLLLTQTAKQVSKFSHDSWLDTLIATSTANLSTASDMQNLLQCFYQHTLLLSRNLPLAAGMCLENIAMLFGFATLFLFKIWSFVPLALFYAMSVLFIAIYRGSAAQINALEISKQREFQEFVHTSVKGRTTIQSLSKQKEFYAEFCTLCDGHATSFYLLHAASRWVTIRIQFLAVIFVGGVWFVSNNHVPTKDAFLFAVLLAAWQLGGYTRRAVRASIEMESGSHCLKSSHSDLKEMGSEVLDWTIESVGPVRDSSIVFDDVHTAATLNGVSFDVEPRQCCGVIGNSRQSVVSALFRLLPLTNGAIWLGGQDIACMPLEDYRRRLALIPLGAPLIAPYKRDFREFIDPDAKLDYRAMNEVLFAVGLASRLNPMASQIVGSLSLEEREMLWLARAIIAQPAVVVLEEACHVTSAQVRQLIPHCTVLVVSSQLPPGVLVECDRVVTVSDGKVTDFGTPMKLSDFNSYHSSQMIGSSMGTLFETQL